eukprot:c19560_g1_i1.p1 GENE.c19560_g1_i1~~c19560_g1_i1.p1  ORF type:complete len:417 (-),score=137.36 c19560_g1_i1:91-1341(-)
MTSLFSKQKGNGKQKKETETNVTSVSNESSSYEAPQAKEKKPENDEEEKVFPIVQYDRYGFLIKDPSKVTFSENPKDLRKENERLVKWQKMLADFPKFRVEHAEKLASRTRKGVPDAVRSLVWKNLAGTHKDNNNQPYSLPDLLKRPIPEACETQIKKDLARTFPSHEFFSQIDPITNKRSQNIEAQNKLFEILHAYAVLDPDVGYCQGMNFIAAIPLFYQPMNDAFHTFLFLMFQMEYREYFLPGFPKLHSSVNILLKLISVHLPKLSVHLERESIVLESFVVQWFLTMFTYNLPFAAIVRLWDWLFVEGHDVVFVVALAVLKLVQDEMLKRKGSDLVAFSMQFSGKLDLASDFVISNALEFKGVIQYVEKLRIKHPDKYCSILDNTRRPVTFSISFDAEGPFYLRNKLQKKLKS